MVEQVQQSRFNELKLYKYSTNFASVMHICMQRLIMTQRVAPKSTNFPNMNVQYFEIVRSHSFLFEIMVQLNTCQKQVNKSKNNIDMHLKHGTV